MALGVRSFVPCRLDDDDDDGDDDDVTWPARCCLMIRLTMMKFSNIRKKPSAVFGWWENVARLKSSRKTFWQSVPLPCRW